MLVTFLEEPLLPAGDQIGEGSRKKPKPYENFKLVKAGQESMSAPTKAVGEKQKPQLEVILITRNSFYQTHGHPSSKIANSSPTV